MPSKATSLLSNPFPVDECTDVLENFDDVSNASYITALEKFKDPNQRKMFVKMSFIRRKIWHKSLE